MRVSQMSDVHNVIIIGSGPAGYTAGLYSARAMLEPLMFAGYMSGGQLMLTSDIENFPGYPEGIGGPEMMMQLREQAERFGLTVQDKNVEAVDTQSRPFKVTVEGEDFFAVGNHRHEFSEGLAADPLGFSALHVEAGHALFS